MANFDLEKILKNREEIEILEEKIRKRKNEESREKRKKERIRGHYSYSDYIYKQYSGYTISELEDMVSAGSYDFYYIKEVIQIKKNQKEIEDSRNQIDSFRELCEGEPTTRLHEKMKSDELTENEKTIVILELKKRAGII